MFLIAFTALAADASFLCLRRGVSVLANIPEGSLKLFSAYAEVFPCCRADPRPRRTFLCLRRGVSINRCPKPMEAVFSLPTQRCFACGRGSFRRGRLFSAYAEVFPDPASGGSPEDAFLCLRRGVSHWSTLRSGEENFSLPTQRCFPMTHCVELSAKLFSAYAEVFPAG